MAIEIVDLPFLKIVIFHIAMLNYQRVNLHFPLVFLWFSYGNHHNQRVTPLVIYPPVDVDHNFRTETFFGFSTSTFIPRVPMKSKKSMAMTQDPTDGGTDSIYFWPIF